MQLKLGEKIKSLRKRDGRRQEDLAEAIGVTNQAVSRWEANKSCPDMGLIPSIANYFHVSIDELFGYDNDRETRLAEYLEKFHKMRDTDVERCRASFEEQEQFMRKALTEFPNEWRFQMRLAWVLESRADESKTDDRISFLKEAEELLEQARKNTDNTGWRDAITNSIVNICKRTGDAEKIERYASESAPVFVCREVLRTFTPDSEKKNRYFSEAILALLHELVQVVHWWSQGNTEFSRSPDPEIFLSLATLLKSMLDGGNYGMFNGDLCLLYLGAASVCAKNGDKRRTVECFDNAFDHHLAFEITWNNKEVRPTSVLFGAAVEMPRLFIRFSDDLLKYAVSVYPEDIGDAIRADPKYASIFD